MFCYHLQNPVRHRIDGDSENLWWVSVNQNDHGLLNDKERVFSFYYYFGLWSKRRCKEVCYRQGCTSPCQTRHPQTDSAKVLIRFYWWATPVPIQNRVCVRSTSPKIIILYIWLFNGILQSCVQRFSCKSAFISLLR